MEVECELMVEQEAEREAGTQSGKGGWRKEQVTELEQELGLLYWFVFHDEESVKRPMKGVGVKPLVKKKGGRDLKSC